MWSDIGFNIPISEGKYWLDDTFIECFDKQGVLHKLYKYKVNQDLTINISKYKDYIECDAETWEETYQRLKWNIYTKIEESVGVILDIFKYYSDYDFWCMTSTGKDSIVTLDLTKLVIPDIKVMFNNTSCDVPDTYRIANQHTDWVITNPQEGIYNYFKRLNFIPSRISRACCTVYKERASVEYFKSHNIRKLIQIMGVRNDESHTRSEYDFLVQNTNWNNPNWYALYPIRKWSDLDVWLYIIHNNLEVNPKYKKGYQRAGCAICCPFCNKPTWVLDKYWYPTLYNRWHLFLQKDFLEKQRWQKINCTLEEYHSCWNGGLFRPEPTEEVIREMMEYKGITDRNVALQYFNKTCCKCGKSVRQNDVLAMNLKLHGRNVDRIFCKKCLMEEHGMSKEEWNKNIESFKRQGCTLF